MVCDGIHDELQKYKQQEFNENVSYEIVTYIANDPQKEKFFLFQNSWARLAEDANEYLQN